MQLVARKPPSSPAKRSTRNDSGQDAPNPSRLKETLEHDLTPWSLHPHSTTNRKGGASHKESASSCNPLQPSNSQRQLSESQFKIALEDLLEPKVRINIAGRQVHATLKEHEDYEGKILTLTRDYLALITRRLNARIDRFLGAPRWRLLKTRLTGRYHEKQAIAQNIPFGLRELTVVRNDGLLIAHLAEDPSTAKLPAFLQQESRRISKEHPGNSAQNRRSSAAIASRLETFAATNNSPTYHLLLTSGPRVTLVAAIQGMPSREIRKQLRLTHRAIEDDLATEPWLPSTPERVQKIHLRHLQCLQDFCRDHHQLSPFPWLQITLATLAIFPLLLGLSAVKHYQQWNRIDQALATAPGFEVIQSSPWSFPLTFSGLRDPLAPTLETVLKQAEVTPPPHTRLRFIPAPSTHPDFILARASRLLQPPQGVTLTLEGNTLHASGAAPRAWIEATRLRAPILIPELTCTLSDLIDTTPAAPTAPTLLADLAEQLVNQRVFFEESEIREPLLTAGHMTEISELIYQLQDEAHLHHLPLEIQIAGRYANPENPFDIAQLSAARDRAAHIRDLLLALRPGIDPIHLHATAEHPFAEEHPEMSRLNRAVEFHVILDDKRISPPALLAEE